MTVGKIIAVLALGAALCLCLGAFVETSHAQTDTKATKTVDKNIANKRGVADSLAKGDKEGSKGATPVQMAIGFGSIFVMIAVLKWL